MLGLKLLLAMVVTTSVHGPVHAGFELFPIYIHTNAFRP